MTAKTGNESECKKGFKVVEEKTEVLSVQTRIRSKEDEEALDKKIAEIRRKNKLIEQRKELVEEDRANFVNECGKTNSRVKWQPNRSKRAIKHPKPLKTGEWDREWDAGKTSVENWKENVPDIDENTKPNAHFPHRSRSNRRKIKTANSTNKNNTLKSNTFQKFSNGINQKQKLDEIKFVAARQQNQKMHFSKKILNSDSKKVVSTQPQKLFDVQKSWNPRNPISNSNNRIISLRSNHLIIPKLSAYRNPTNASFNKHPSNPKPIRTYRKPNASNFTRRYSNRRAVSQNLKSSAVNLTLTTAATKTIDAVTVQRLDTVKVNVSTLDLKKDNDENIFNSKSRSSSSSNSSRSNNNNNNNNIDNDCIKSDNDNGTKKLIATVGAHNPTTMIAIGSAAINSSIISKHDFRRLKLPEMSEYKNYNKMVTIGTNQQLFVPLYTILISILTLYFNSIVIGDCCSNCRHSL